jgi:hypothetical protein
MVNHAETLRKKVIKANAEMTRLMGEYEVCGVEVVWAPSRADMATWLSKDRPRRRAYIPPSPGIDLTQSTASSNLTQQLGDAVLSDDYTASEESSHGGEGSVEDRSVNTETGMPDTQMTDETFSPEEKNREKKDKKLKKAMKAAKKEEEHKEDDEESDGSGNSTQY